MKLFEERIPTEIPGKFIQISLSFNKETMHWATASPKQKGYQVTVTPINVEQRENGLQIVSFGAFTGFYEIIHPCERQSKKQLEIAIQKIEAKKQIYIDHINAKQKATI